MKNSLLVLALSLPIFSFSQTIAIEEVVEGTNLANIAQEFMGNPKRWIEIKVYRPYTPLVTKDSVVVIQPGDLLFVPVDFDPGVSESGEPLEEGDFPIGTSPTESQKKFITLLNRKTLSDYCLVGFFIFLF